MIEARREMRGPEWTNSRTRRNSIQSRRWTRLVISAGEPQLASRSGRSAGENYSKWVGWASRRSRGGRDGCGVKKQGPEGWWVVDGCGPGAGL